VKIPKPVVIDFESHGIQSRPLYPPMPVGVSIKYPGKKAKYYAFGHLTENNCSWGEARGALVEAYKCKDGLLFQNGKFDLDVAEVHMGLPVPAWYRLHDSVFLLFLDDPNQIELGLKPSAARLLNMPADEQDAVGEWLIANQPVPGIKISKAKSSDNYFGAYIAYAPGKLVGEYANGDTERTEKIFNLLYKKTVNRGMLEAYNRERELMPILLEMERQGIQVDLPRLRKDVELYCHWFAKVDTWIIKTLKAPADINLDSGAQLVDAMIAAKKADPDKMLRTPTGKFQTNKDALLVGVNDKALLGMLKCRASLKTCINTFMQSWLDMAELTGGTIHTNWNQIKSSDGGIAGTRTGRLSATWFMNIPKEFTPIWAHEEEDAKKAKLLPKCPLKGLPSLPKVRSYITPFKGDVIIDRDYCFGPGTEVLTERGFVLFESLPYDVKVAQWKNGELTYDYPLEYQSSKFDGELISIKGERSTDLLVTPNHQCLIAKNNFTLFTRADEYPTRGYQQLHAGTYIGKYRIDAAKLQLVVAIQADATIKTSSIAWKLKKARKITRLHALLNGLKLKYTVTSPPSAPDYSITYLKLEHLPEWVAALLDLGTKTFRRTLLDAAPDLRLSFLRELSHWDGRRNASEKFWSYFTTNEVNGELIQEMAVTTGLRSVANKKTLPSNKIFTSVAMRLNSATWTDTFKITKVPYQGRVYCVTMPHGTVVIRRNGRICVTGNSQQEPRILGHFDGGALMQKYLDDPWVDFHDYAKAELEKMGKFYDRKPVKNTNLGLIYGMGAGKLAEKNNMSVEEASELKKAILKLYPGLKDMYKDAKIRALTNVPVRTWGGREYYCEPPKMIDNRMREFSYKLPNALIQGSAADCTKEALIRFNRVREQTWKIILNVHDQITVSVPKRDKVEAMEVLRQCMESIEFDVPMLSEGAVSETNWDELKDYDKKGKRL
jgi:DNA polymerase I-like protein with 3'-5' exonuclease and polymerase domains